MLPKLLFYGVAVSSIAFIVGLALANPEENLAIAFFILACSLLLGSFIVFMRAMMMRVFPGNNRSRSFVVGSTSALFALGIPFAAKGAMNFVGIEVHDPFETFLFLFVVFVLLSAATLFRGKAGQNSF